MAWAKSDFRTYPARCRKLHLEAAAMSPTRLLAGAWKSEMEAASEATLLRQFRFLVRNNPGVDLALDGLMSENSFRTRLFLNPFGDYCLYLTARPRLDVELLALNPHLAGIV